MGMESFNAAPVPDESERIDDVAKAEEMARTGDRQRTIAASKRASGTPMGASPERHDEAADKKEDEAATLYDFKKDTEGMSVEGLTAAFSETETALNAKYDQIKHDRTTGAQTDRLLENEKDFLNKKYSILEDELAKRNAP